MPTFIHAATGRTVTVPEEKAGKYDRLRSWERAGISPDPDPEQEADPVRVDSDGQLVDPPPKAGPGSSREAWVAYAAQLGVEVGGDDTRDDIIAAVGVG